MPRFLAILLCLAALPAIAAEEKPKAAKEPPAAEDAEEKPPEYNTIVLQGLNKVTGHISKIEGALQTPLRFGNIEIIAKRCWKSSPEEQPENAALLEISEFKPGESAVRIFQGWMFSSSPGLSGLEHPVYDVTVIACEEREVKTEEEEKKEEPKEEPAKKEAKPEKPKATKKK